MRQCIPVACVAVLWSGLGSLALAEDAKDAQAILDKAIKALGGEARLSTVKAATWKTKETVTFMGNANEFKSQATVQGLDHYRQEGEGSFGKFGLVLNGDKGWRQSGDKNTELDEKDVAILKRTVYLQLLPLTVLPLKDKCFKVEVAGEEKVGDRTAVGLKITLPDGKEFKLYFDKETGLPVKEVAKVAGFRGEEFTLETTYDKYKDFNGIKKATKIASKRNGEKFLEAEVTEFKVLDKVDPQTFDQAK